MSGATFDSLVASIASRVAEVRHICATNTSKEVEIVAVTKGHDVSVIEAAYGAGLRLFGENYAEELATKARELESRCPEIRWTFQGRLQTNKINRLVPFVSLWQTVDSESRVDALARRAPGAAALLQINLTGSPAQGGVSLGEVPHLLSVAFDAGLKVLGLMGIGPADDRDEAVFQRAVAVADEFDLPVRSFGMSDDFEAAVRSGSTMIRLGGRLFGPRHQ